MKLEPKHLAPYLPFGLKLQWHNGEIGYLREIAIEKGSQPIHGETMSAVVHQVKPILRPLSDLIKEIEHNGEKFVPVMRLFEVLKPSRCEVYTWKDNYKTIQLRYKHTDGFNTYKNFHHQDVLTMETFDKVQKLLEWHFDVFNLIDQGLAIDINFLNQ